jgi:PucR C-terminal helix-turn-helix domain
MLDAFIEQIPLYGHLPREQLEGEILDILRHNLRVFFSYLDEGRAPSDEELGTIRSSAARRAEERIPLEAVLTAYHLGALIGWQALREEAAPEEVEEVLDIAERVLLYTQSVTSAVAQAYVEERQAIYGEERDARRTLAEALLSGTSIKGMAERAGHEPAPAYVVLAMEIGTSPDEKDVGVEGAVASRRKLRRLESELEARTKAQALPMLTPAGGIVLLPALPEECEEVVADSPKLVDALAAAAGAEVVAGVSWRESADVPIGADEAREVVRLACEQGRSTGAYTLDDVLLEFLLTRPSQAAEKLERVLDPLADGPELIATLEGYFAADFDRRRAAGNLHIHPNTLDYRLRRVAELTGLSVGTAKGVQVLGAALTIRRMRAES